ncbi:penicillin binding protein PBP4B [Alteromonas gilva]|uniref:Penicillin binding protein PBP4B n=1 Tax=Alteromonas gilva TaxID=2987522 RepID=A0ABT5L8F9_9ALTE|nr:penicillin binding protein PBP4B [Alteromonas gilva]MDC8832192.1 penicillin binding protein PBP4B [Alteromonas gilva]
MTIQGFRSAFLWAICTLLLLSCSSRQVIDMPSANYGERVKSLVIHYTAIDYARSVDALVNEGGLSAHYLVPESNDPSDPDGKPRIIQLVDESKRAWHAGKSYWQGRTGLNDHSIGIEIVNVPECQRDTQMAASQAEHGDSRLCFFPDYDPAQIAVVIELAKDIIARNPDIAPTSVVGHSDIAFTRKNDPGPRFPWFELYQAGIGAWYDNDTMAGYWKTFSEQTPSIGLLQSAMRRYGYGIIETGIADSQTLNAIAAFQMHFLPWHVTGQPDSRTAAAVFALLDKYFPAHKDKLLARYHTERDILDAQAKNAVPATPRRGQIDTWLPAESPSKRQYVNDRFAFKSYAGRGKLLIETDQPAQATLSVNGQTLNLADTFNARELYRYSLHRRTHNGINTLAVTDITPPDAKIHLQVPYPELIDNTDAYKQAFSAVDALINREVAEGFPGAVLLVVKDGEIIKRSAYGYQKRYDENQQPLASPQPMRTDTLFDLASNTKMFATTFALMHLVETGQLDVNQPIQYYLPEYRGDGREARRVSDLLSHQSGYAPSIAFYTPDNTLGELFYSQNKQRTSELLITRAPFVTGNGLQAAYSDTNFMLLGLIVERITGMPLDRYTENYLYQPLGLSNTLFNPLYKGHHKDEFAATELNGNTRGGRIEFPNIRQYTLQGEVHDEKAFYAMQGVAGHAGLFATADDLAVLAQTLLNGGGYGETHLFDSNVINAFIKPDNRFWQYGLGWRRAANGINRWHFGPYASDQAYGHTGWTGTATVIDPALDLAVILLTNSRHSPIVEEQQDRPIFTGKQFETGKYGSIVSLVYEAVLNRTAAP